MPQAVVQQYIDNFDNRDYPAGAVVTFTQAHIDWLKSRRLVDDSPSVVTAAVNAGAPQFSHLPAAAQQSPVPGALLRPRARNLGDSNFGEHVFDTSYTPVANVCSAGLTSRGWFNAMQAKRGQPFEVVQWGGISGNRLQQMLARMDNRSAGPFMGDPNWSTNQIGVTPYPAEWTFIEAPINNLGDGDDLETMAPLAIALLDKLRGSRNVWPTPIAPGASQSGYPGVGNDYLARLLRWRDFLMSLTRTYDNLVVPDVWSKVVTPSSSVGNSAVGLTRDGAIHFNNVSAMIKEAAVWGEISKWVRSFPGFLPASSAEVVTVNAAIAQYQPDPLFLGPTSNVGADTTAGAISGGGTLKAGSVYLTGITFNATAGASILTSMVPNPVGPGNMLQCDVTLTNASDNVQVLLPDALANVAGVRTPLRAVARVLIQGKNGVELDATHKCLTVKQYLRNRRSDGVVNDYRWCMQENAGDAAYVGSQDWTMATHHGLTPTPGALLFRQGFYAMPSAAGAEFRFLIGTAGLKPAPLPELMN